MGHYFYSKEFEALITKEMREEFQRWNSDGKLLKQFTEEKSHLKQAQQFARENPDAYGFVTFPNSRTGGWWFYKIQGGNSYPCAAIHAFMEIEEKVPDEFYYDYIRRMNQEKNE